MHKNNYELSMICAHDNNGAIGFKNELLWKGDLKHFKETTSGHVVIMGRNTYESVGSLPNRLNIVISNTLEKTELSKLEMSKNLIEMGSTVILGSVDEVSNFINKLINRTENKISKVFVIGGSSIYNLYVEHVDTMYLTAVDTFFEKVDTYLPQINFNAFKSVKIKQGICKDGIIYTIKKYVRMGINDFLDSHALDTQNIKNSEKSVLISIPFIDLHNRKDIINTIAIYVYQNVRMLGKNAIFICDKQSDIEKVNKIIDEVVNIVNNMLSSTTDKISHDKISVIVLSEIFDSYQTTKIINSEFLQSLLLSDIDLYDSISNGTHIDSYTLFGNYFLSTAQSSDESLTDFRHKTSNTKNYPHGHDETIVRHNVLIYIINRLSVLNINMSHVVFNELESQPYNIFVNYFDNNQVDIFTPVYLGESFGTKQKISKHLIFSKKLSKSNVISNINGIFESVNKKPIDEPRENLLSWIQWQKNEPSEIFTKEFENMIIDFSVIHGVRAKMMKHNHSYEEKIDLVSNSDFVLFTPKTSFNTCIGYSELLDTLSYGTIPLFFGVLIDVLGGNKKELLFLNDLLAVETTDDIVNKIAYMQNNKLDVIQKLLSLSIFKYDDVAHNFIKFEYNW